MRARDLMTSPVHTVRAKTTVGEAAAILTRHDITALPVLDEDDRLIGVVAEGDLLWHRVPASADAHLWRRPDDGVEDPPGTVGEVMTTPAVALAPGAEAAGIAEVLLACDLHSVPIVEGSIVVGIVSRRDLLRTLVRQDEALGAEARYRLDEYGAGIRHWDVAVEDGVATVTGSFEGADEHALKVLVGTVPGIRTTKLVPAAETAR